MTQVQSIGGVPVLMRFAFAALMLGAASPASPMGQVVVSPTSFYPGYTPSILNYAATHGGILTQVVGNPFDVPQEDLDRAIAGVMAVSHFGQNVPFVTTRPEGFRSPYRVIVLFDNQRGYTTVKLCGEDPASFQPAWEGKLRIHAALCANKNPLTSVFGDIAGATGPNDPLFRKLIGQITLGLLPPFNPDRQDPSDHFMRPFGGQD